MTAVSIVGNFLHHEAGEIWYKDTGHELPARILAIILAMIKTMKASLTDRRNRGERRWGLNTEFPLRDSNGVTVVTERRVLADRRLENTSLEDRLLMFAGLVPLQDGNDAG